MAHWGALSFRDSGAGQQCDRRSTSGRPCGLQCVGWIGVGGSGRPGEKRLGYQPEFWEGDADQLAQPLPTLLVLYPRRPLRGPVSFAFQTLFPLSHRHTAP